MIMTVTMNLVMLMVTILMMMMMMTMTMVPTIKYGSNNNEDGIRTAMMKMMMIVTGVFTCEALDYDQVQSQEVALDVVTSPSVVITPLAANVREGEAVSFRCFSPDERLSRYSYRWQKVSLHGCEVLWAVKKCTCNRWEVVSLHGCEVLWAVKKCTCNRWKVVSLHGCEVLWTVKKCTCNRWEDGKRSVYTAVR